MVKRVELLEPAWHIGVIEKRPNVVTHTAPAGENIEKD
jgi:hypothetical protein